LEPRHPWAVAEKEKEVDRIEGPPGRKTEFASRGEIANTDPAENDTVTGREDHLGLAEAAAVAGREINTAPSRGAKSPRHDPGSGANETVDGLSGTEEALRQAAEDTPSGRSDGAEDIPVFDRAQLLPKI